MHLVLLLAVAAAAVTPLPTRSDRLIYDEAGVLHDATERRLEARHRDLLAKTGVAIVVITVPSLVGETIDELALRVGQDWGVGRRGQDRGLVVAFARDDRRIHVATGYGTEGYLPDGRVGALLDEHALPHLRAGDPDTALAQLSDALVDASAREYNVTLGGSAPGESAPPAGWSLGGTALLVLAAIAFLFLARRHPALALMLFASLGRRGGSGRGGFGGGGGLRGFGGGGFGGGGAGRGY